MARQFKRSQRLSGQILRDISQLMATELSEVAGGMLTFTRVRLSDDLQHAKIYYSFLGSDDDRSSLENYLAQHRKQIRSRIGRHLHVHNIPEIVFTYDPSIEEGIRIEQLLNDINRKDNSA